MNTKLILRSFFIISLLLMVPAAFSQEASAPPPAGSGIGSMEFGLDLGLGTDVIDGQTYQSLTLGPDIAIGDFGIGLDLNIRFKLDLAPGAAQPFQIYAPDWIPDATHSFWDIYLPKIKYLRYGQKGQPFFIKLGSIEDGTLGNGFIMGNYANTNFLPQTKIFGMSLDIDGALFNFPFVGFESFIGNLAQFDVVGVRLYIRPLSFFDIPVLNALQIGGTLVADNSPYLYSLSGPTTKPQVLVGGVDFRLPILATDLVSLSAYGDFVMQGTSSGGMIGAGGKLFGFFNYGAQIRILGPGFIPTYFDSSYDLFRINRYVSFSSTHTGETTAGWYASLGVNFDKNIIFNISMDGPFAGYPTVPSTNNGAYPHIKGVFLISDKLLGGFSLSAYYEKFYLGRNGDFWGDLVSPNNAFIGMIIGYKTGPATISLVYNLIYDQTAIDPASAFKVTSSLKTSISLF